jgi:hypothetical protein
MLFSPKCAKNHAFGWLAGWPVDGLWMDCGWIVDGLWMDPSTILVEELALSRAGQASGDINIYHTNSQTSIIQG